jgi:hypothetical protein
VRETSSIERTSGRAEAFRRDGYLVVPGACAKELERLRDRLDEHRATESMRYDSARRRIRKVPQLAETDEVYRTLARAPTLVETLEELVGPARIFRDVLIDKPAHDGAHVRDHQDIAYWDVSPPELVVSAWIALDDAPTSSGCLEVVPGSHLSLVPHRLVAGRLVLPRGATRALRAVSSLTGTGDNPRTAWQRRFAKVKNFALGTLTRLVPAIGDLNDLHIDPAAVPERVPVPVRAGDAILFESRLVHASGPNSGGTRRRAYIVSYMSARCRVPGSSVSDFLPAREDALRIASRS